MSLAACMEGRAIALGNWCCAKAKSAPRLALEQLNKLLRQQNFLGRRVGLHWMPTHFRMSFSHLCFLRRWMDKIKE
jgi:hypothetical protein